MKTWKTLRIFPLFSLLLIVSLFLAATRTLQAEDWTTSPTTPKNIEATDMTNELSGFNQSGNLAQDVALLVESYFSQGTDALKEPIVKNALVRVGVALQNTGRLDEGLDLLTKALVKAKILNYDEKTRAFLVQTVTTAIHAELQQRGLTPDGTGRSHESWQSLSERIINEIIAVPELKLDLGRKEFWSAFEEQSQTRFSNLNAVKLLVNGPTSFAQRAALIDQAKNEIFIMSWSIEDDTTGLWLQRKLIEKRAHNPKIQIKIMVDGQTAQRIGYRKILSEMENMGFSVIRWTSPDPTRLFDGQHRKALIVDNEFMVAGGLNWGDAYSHLDTTQRKPWRDTDIYARGPVVADTRTLFMKLWNEQQKDSQFKIHPMSPAPNIQTPRDGETLASMAVINHSPGKGENILRSIVASIEAARSEITIQNAYFIMDPLIESALKRALSRQVRVRVLTNSQESVDEPIVNRPIMKSLNKLLKMGARVYVKNGRLETLHSKVMVVDDDYSWVGSQNFHPRSFRYEGEVIFAVRSTEFSRQVKAMIEKDLSERMADGRNSIQELTQPINLAPDPVADLSEELFFDQL